MPTRQTFPLGIGDATLQLGAHVANWYRTREEKFSTLAGYMTAGIASSQFCLAVIPGEDLDDFRQRAPSLKAAELAGQFVLGASEDFYFKNKKFHPNQLIRSYPGFLEQAAQKGLKSLRGAGEIPWRLMVHLSMTSFFEYEERINADFFDCYPAMGMCLFDMERYGAEYTLGILRTHPMMLAKGVAFDNPSYYQG